MEPAVVPKGQLRGLQPQSAEDRPVRLHGEDNFFVVHALGMVGAPGGEVFVQQPSQGHSRVQVCLGRQRTEPQGLHQFDIEPQSGHIHSPGPYSVQSTVSSGLVRKKSSVCTPAPPIQPAP